MAFAAGVSAPLVVAQVPAGSDPETPLVPGARIVRFDPSRPDDGVTNLTAGFAAAGRPDVSFDGRRILFVARRTAEDPQAVWEMNADGSEPRRITTTGDGEAAIYLSTIYTIDADEPARQIAFTGSKGPRSLYTCRLDGSRLRQITFDPAGATAPCALADGRILYSSGGTALFTVNTDGTDVFPFADADLPPARRGMACETPGGWVVYVERPTDSRAAGGAVFAVSSTAGRASRRPVTRDPSGLYRNPSPLDDETVLVSYRRPDGGSWGIHALDLRRGTRTETILDEPEWDEVDAAALRARAAPAGRSSVVDDRLDTGRLYCLNTYLSGTHDTRDAGGDEIASMAIFRARADGRGQDLLGLVPVEPDGSMHAVVPARAPLRLQTLDARGQVVGAMRSWFWVMPREARGCIGCHEDRELTPPNRHVLALRGEPRVPAPPAKGDAK